MTALTLHYLKAPGVDNFMTALLEAIEPVSDTALFHKAPEDLLVTFAKQGNEKAFEELISRSSRGCLNVANAILRNRYDAQDEVQNAFLKAYTHISLFDGQSRFSTWITRIVINHCLMRYRRARLIPFVSYEATSNSGKTYVAYEPVEHENPERRLGGSEVTRLLCRELERIPQLLRIPLEMRYMHDLSLEETAQRLGISIAATKSRLYRGHLYLRERMLTHCGRRGPATLTAVTYSG